MSDVGDELVDEDPGSPGGALLDDPNREAVGEAPIWTNADGGEPDGGEPEAVPEPLAYDPGAHTVADVEAYLAAHPNERDAVLAAEAAGKARVSLVGEG